MCKELNEEKILKEFEPEKIGMRIKELRIAAGLSVRELASKIYIGPYAIHKFERGGSIPKVSSLVYLSLALGPEATIDYMLLGRRTVAASVIELQGCCDQADREV